MYNEARTIFDDMRKAGCKANVVTYTSLMIAYSNAGTTFHTLNISQLSCWGKSDMKNEMKNESPWTSIYLIRIYIFSFHSIRTVTDRYVR